MRACIRTDLSDNIDINSRSVFAILASIKLRWCMVCTDERDEHSLDGYDRFPFQFAFSKITFSSNLFTLEST